jgi:uncharacterized protein (DUF4415 family)
MAKNSSGPSARGTPRTANTVDVKTKHWTHAEREALRKAAEAQAEGQDEEIMFEDIPRLTEDQLKNLVRKRDSKPKVKVSVRLDPEVLKWLRSKGEGHLTRINDILTNLMEAERKSGTGR